MQTKGKTHCDKTKFTQRRKNRQTKSIKIDLLIIQPIVWPDLLYSFESLDDTSENKFETSNENAKREIRVYFCVFFRFETIKTTDLLTSCMNDASTTEIVGICVDIC